MRSYARASVTAAALLAIAACSDSTPTSTGRLAPTEPDLVVGGVAGASYTGTNQAADGGNYCLNGPGLVNCNLYQGKQYVWLNGGPTNGTSQLTDGVYYFVVGEPGGENSHINDFSPAATDKNLSDDHDTYLNRRFVVQSHHITAYLPDADGATPNHDFDAGTGQIRLALYSTTTNNGGEYFAAVCRIGDVGTTTLAAPAQPADCKYDNFKVRAVAQTPVLTVTKTANPSFRRTYAWSILKQGDVGSLTLPAGNTATINYTVRVTNTGSSDDQFAVGGNINVANSGAVDATLQGIVDETDVSGLATIPVSGANCSLSVSGGGQGAFGGTIAGFVLKPGSTLTCTYASTATFTPSLSTTYTNTATATISDPATQNGTLDYVGSATFSFTAPSTQVNNCITVTDTYNGALGTACVGSLSGPDVNGKYYKDFTYARIVGPYAFGLCGKQANVDNTATITETGANSSVSIPVSVQCGCTLGYWKNNDLYDWKRVSGVYTFVAAGGAANSSSGDWFWKGTLSPSAYTWPNAAPSTYRTKSSKLNQPQAFGTTALSDAAYSTLAGLTFDQALNLGGGDTFLGKAQNLLRQATASLLNASWSDGTHTIGFPMTSQQVVDAVNTALATKNAATITALQVQLAGYNQAGTQDLTNNHACPINSRGDFITQ